MRLSRLVFVAALSVSPLALTHSAHAFDSNGFVKQLETLIESDGAEVTYGAVEQNGETLTINNFVIENDKTESKSAISKLTFTNPAQNGNGGFSYDGLEAQTIVHTGKNDSKLEIETLASTGLEFAESPDSDPLPEKVDSLVLTNTTFSRDGDSSKGSLTIPSISAKGFVRTSTRNFKLQEAKIAPFQGRVFGDEGEPVDINFSGASVNEFEYFGLFGLDIGSVNLGSMTIDTVVDDGPVNVSMEGVELENYYAWDGSDPNRPLIPDGDTRVKIKPIDVTLGGKTFISMDQSEAVAINDAAELTSKSTGQFKNISIDLSALPDDAKASQGYEQVKDLGYEKLTLNISVDASADLKSGILDIAEMKYDFLNAGSFNVKLNVSGYTEQVAKSIATTASKLQTDADNPQAQQAQMLQLMAMFAPLSLQKLELEVTDASLLGKVLDVQARRNNRNAEELAAVIPPMAGIMLAPLQLPELASSLSAALGIFMQGNKTISASIEPQGGLALTEIIALSSGVQAGSTAPSEVVNRLNLKVTAE
ncbi:MAG: hypothetical protein QNJ29_00600 [Rhizobiaceae bacterium]|nr:hypothetical protein [Rhizobiaceae bacterium]